MKRQAPEEVPKYGGRYFPSPPQNGGTGKATAVLRMQPAEQSTQGVMSARSNIDKLWQLSRPGAGGRCKDGIQVDDQLASLSSGCYDDPCTLADPKTKKPRVARPDVGHLEESVAKLQQDKLDLQRKLERLKKQAEHEQQMMKCAAKAISHWKEQCGVLQHQLKTQQTEHKQEMALLQDRLALAKETAMQGVAVVGSANQPNSSESLGHNDNHVSSDARSSCPVPTPCSEAGCIHERRRLVHKVAQLEREVVSAWAEQASMVAAARRPMELEVVRLQQELNEARGEREQTAAAAAGALKGMGEVVVSLLAQAPQGAPPTPAHPGLSHQACAATSTAREGISWPASGSASKLADPQCPSGNLETPKLSLPQLPADAVTMVEEANPLGSQLQQTGSSMLVEMADVEATSSRSDQCVMQTGVATTSTLSPSPASHPQAGRQLEQQQAAEGMAARQLALAVQQSAQLAAALAASQIQQSDLAAALATAGNRQAQLTAERDSMCQQLRSTNQRLKQCRQWWAATKARHVERMEAAAMKLQRRCSRVETQMEQLHSSVRGCDRCATVLAHVRATASESSCSEDRYGSMAPPVDTFPIIRRTESCML